MLSAFAFVREMTHLAVLIRITAAVICGGVVGLEREIRRRSAGFRTHILICMGAAITMLTSQYLVLCAGYYTDMARLGAQVIAGIGFIGGGAIVVTKHNHIRGLTTGAGLWCSAIIGLACGAGFIELALLGTLIIIIAELLLIRFEMAIVSKITEFGIIVEYKNADSVKNVLSGIRSEGGRVLDLEITRSAGDEEAYRAEISIRANKKEEESMLSLIAHTDNVISVTRL